MLVDGSMTDFLTVVVSFLADTAEAVVACVAAAVVVSPAAVVAAVAAAVAAGELGRHISAPIRSLLLLQAHHRYFGIFAL